MHQRMDYRISGAFEKNEEISFQRFKDHMQKKNIKMIRMKFRKTFQYQYMEYAFTRVFEVTKEPEIIQILFQLKKNNEPPQEDFINQVLLGATMPKEQPRSHKDMPKDPPSSETYEIEIELTDVNYQLQVYNNPNDREHVTFHKLIDRFIGNAESFYFFRHEGDHMFYKTIFQQDEEIRKQQNLQGDEVVYPEYGKYLDSLKRQRII